MIRFRQGLLSLIVGIAAFSAFPGSLWAPNGPPHFDIAALKHCSSLMSSGDFHIQEKLGSGTAVRVGNALTNKISDLLQFASDENFQHDQGLIRNYLEARADFDLLQHTIDSNVEKGDWSVDPKSDEILDQCFNALHPTEKP